MKNKNPESRRNFLLKGFTDKDQLIEDIASLLRDENESTEKVKMLTPDGKLVEVDSRVLKNRHSTAKTTNAEILKWMEEGKKKQKP